jgi:hypothetical protein
MPERAGRADLVFKLLLAALIGLWLAYPPGERAAHSDARAAAEVMKR